MTTTETLRGLLREATNDPEYWRKQRDRLPSVLREHITVVLQCEAEPHVIADAVDAVQGAACLIESLLDRLEKAEAALVRIADTDWYTSRRNPQPHGGLRGHGGMIACFALIGENGSYHTNQSMHAALAEMEKG